MPKSLIALLLIAACGPAMGQSTIAAQPTAHDGPTKGQLRAEWVPSNTYDRGELSIYRTRDNSLLQKMSLEVPPIPVNVDSVRFWDINGDGFEDFVFINNEGGYYTKASDVYLWVPVLKRFVMSETLSGRGELSKAKDGCVQLSSKCSGIAYNTSVYCFNIKRGRWRLTSDDGCNGPAPE